ncbi:hypothetical protein GCM10027294_28670 [Marinactinospora endophytica]
MFSHIPTWDMFAVGRRRGQETPRARRSFEARLPSRFQAMPFTAEFRLFLPGPREGEGGEEWLFSLQEEIRETAARISVQYSLIDHGSAGNALNRYFTRFTGGPPGMSVDVILCPPNEADLARTRERELVDFDADMAAARHAEMVGALRNLRADVFADPVLARLWWLREHPDQVERLPQVGAALDDVVGHVDPSTGDDQIARVGGLFLGLMRELPGQEREYLVRSLAGWLGRAFHACGRPELGNELAEIAEGGAHFSSGT